MGTHLFEDLPAVLQKYSEQIVPLVSMVVQRAALGGGDYLASETPVDTGMARSNWIMGVDERIEAVLPPYFPYPTYRVSKEVGEAESFSRKDEHGNLDAVRVQQANAAAGFSADRNSAIYITNSSPQIAVLNEGRSHQTDPGFFEKSPSIAIKAIKGTWRLREVD